MIPQNWQRFAERIPEGRILLALTSPTHREPWEPPSWRAKPDVQRNRFYAFWNSPPASHSEDGDNVRAWLATHPGAHVLYPLIKRIQPEYVAYIYPKKYDADHLASGRTQAEIDKRRAEIATEDRGDVPRYLVNLLRALVDKDGDALRGNELKGAGMKWTARMITRLTGAPLTETLATLAADPRLAGRRERERTLADARKRERAEANARDAWRRFIFPIDGVDLTGLEARDALAERAKLVITSRAPKSARLVFFTERDAETGKWRILSYPLENSLAASFDVALPAGVPVLKGTVQVYTTTVFAEEFSGDLHTAGRFNLAIRAITPGGQAVIPDILAGTPAFWINTHVSLSKRAEAVADRDGHLPRTWYYAHFILLDPKTAPASLDPFTREREENAREVGDDEDDPVAASLFQRGGTLTDEDADAAKYLELGNFDFPAAARPMEVGDTVMLAGAQGLPDEPVMLRGFIGDDATVMMRSTGVQFTVPRSRIRPMS
jgi:hypothetical protein